MDRTTESKQMDNRIPEPAVRDMCIAVQELGLWEAVRDFQGTSFMLDQSRRFDKIDSHPLVDKYGHSGASFGIALRSVQYIAKNGVEAYHQLIQSRKN